MAFVPVAVWISEVEERITLSSELTRIFFAVPEIREPTAEERGAARRDEQARRRRAARARVCHMGA